MVDQSTTTASRTFLHEVKISTSLVSSATALSLVRALQTMQTIWDNFDYRIPADDDDLEIDVDDDQLRRWLGSNDGDSSFDRTDRFSNSVRRVECESGRAITKALGINDPEPTFIYGTWGHPEVNDFNKGRLRTEHPATRLKQPQVLDRWRRQHRQQLCPIRLPQKTVDLCLKTRLIRERRRNAICPAITTA